MDVNEVRRTKARKLARQLAGDGDSGFREIAEKMGWSQSQTSQMLGANAPRKITDKRAREIECEFGKPHGWLDQPNEQPPASDLDEDLLLHCLQAVRKEVGRLNFSMSPDELDELSAQAVIILYKFSREAGKVLSADLALSTALRTYTPEPVTAG